MFKWIRKPDFSAITRLDYDEYWRTRGFRMNDGLKDREKVIYAAIPAGSRVLDMGCGNSRLPLALKEKGCDMTVADIAAIVLDGYRSLGIPAHQVDLADLATLSQLNGQRFDYLILSEVLEHTSNPEEIVAAVSRLSGHLVITIPNSAYFWFRLGLMFRGRFFTQWVHHPSEHLRFWSHSDFLDWLQAMDLELIAAKASNGARLLKDIWPNLFGFQMVYVCKTRN